MALTAEWRSFGEFDVVLVVEDGIVREAMTAEPAILNNFLTSMSGLRSWAKRPRRRGRERPP